MIDAPPGVAVPLAGGWAGPASESEQESKVPKQACHEPLAGYNSRNRMVSGGVPVKSPHRLARVATVAWCVWCAVSAAPALAQAPPVPLPGPAMESLRVPGGAAHLLAQAELDPDIPRARALREVIRVIYDAAEQANQATDTRRARVLDYLSVLSAFEASASAFKGTPPSLQQAEAKPVRQQLERMAQVLGASLEKRAGKYLLLLDTGDKPVRRRQLLDAAGFQVQPFIDALNAGRPAALALPADTVPLPLPTAAWQSALRVSEDFAGSLLTAILSDRRAALFYYGLLGVDADTRAFLARTPELLKDILQSNRAAVFASCGSAFAVAEGRVAVPGGPAAVPLWEAVVGEPVASPARFASKLFDKDDGRLALFYHSLAFIDPPLLTFALGVASPDPGRRVDRFRRLYDVSAVPLAGWNPAARPFSRTRVDMVRLLQMTPVDDRGRLGALSPERFWRRVFVDAPIPSDPAAELEKLDEDGPVDAAAMMEMLAGPAQLTERAEAWAFGHRVFGTAPRAGLPDALVALRAFPKYHVLVYALDRMGVADPAVYAAAIRRAERLSKISERRAAMLALGLFQGSLALVERARLGRVIDSTAASDLVAELAKADFTEDGDSAGRVRAWVATSLLPALAAGLPANGAAGAYPYESVVLAACAGRALSLSDSPDLGLTLEGLPYRVDPAAAEFARYQAVREKQRSVPLDVALEVGERIDALLERGVTVETLPGLVQRLERAFQTAMTVGNAKDSPWLDAGGAARSVGRAANDLKKIAKPKDLSKILKTTRPLLPVADALLAHAIVSLVYTPHLGEADGTALMAGDPSVRHDWGIATVVSEPRVPESWKLPFEDRAGEGWHLQGALLGIDVTLSQQVLRRVVTDKVPGPPTISSMDAQMVTEGVALAVPFDYTDADREVIVSALRRGRSRLEALVRAPGGWPAVANRAGIRDVRRELVPWMLANEPNHLSGWMSYGEVMRIGMVEGAPLKSANAWGTSGRGFDGRWTLRFPSSQPFELATGRKGSAAILAALPDLALAVAESLHAKGLPAVLTRAVLAAAAQDFSDEVRQAYDDDWMAMIAAVPALVPRVDEYVAALTTGGGLVPVARQ